MGLRIAMVASEVTPFAKTGGLADVAAALCKHLHGAGHDVRLFMPFYSRIDRAALELAPLESLQQLPLEFGGHRYQYSVHSSRLPNSDARVYLIDCPTLYARAGIYTADVDEHLRFLALTRASIECCQRMGWAPQIFHFNDWHTAFGPLLLKSAYAWDQLFAATRSVLSIHNIGYQGVFAAASAEDIALGDKFYLLHQDDLAQGRINSLKHGVMYADLIATVSPTYAREILSAEYGMGLQDDLAVRASQGQLVGILNGVDYDDWDPRWDQWLPRHFGPFELDIKAGLKKEFLSKLRLKTRARTMLLGLVSRFTVQKGFDLLFDTLPPLLATRDLCFVALGSGEERYEKFFAQLQRQFPERAVFHRGYSDEMAHWIEAASDAFVMPSLYEPCGLNQMYSLRYGTVPIVRRTGGLADSVQLFDPATGLGTGIVFNDYNTTAMGWALRTTLDLYRQPAAWKRLVQNAMAQDFSWERQGKLYIDMYQRLAGLS